MDDSIEEKRKLEKLTDMPAVDMSMPDGGASVGENLEVDDDDDEANKLDEANRARAKDSMDVDDEEEEDPLDAFMNGVKQEVKKVDELDMKKMKEDPSYRRRLEERINEDGDVDEEPEAVEDELDATDLNP